MERNGHERKGVDMKGYKGSHERVGTKGAIVLVISALSPILGLIVLRIVHVCLELIYHAGYTL